MTTPGFGLETRSPTAIRRWLETAAPYRYRDGEVVEEK